MFKAHIAGSMLDKAAHRVRVAHLERERTHRAYKAYLKETKNPKELENNPTFDQLRSDMQVAASNYLNANQTYLAIRTVPPL